VICAITGTGTGVDGNGAGVGGITCATGGTLVGTAVLGALVKVAVAVGASDKARLFN
jgi:hypothetical protein